MPPHSQTVRGTLSNPKTQAAKQSDTPPPPNMGDPVSLSSSKTDSVPLSSVRPVSDARPADPYRQNENATPASKTTSSSSSSSSSKEKLPHSKQVRGTLDNEAGPRVNKSMLGDPVSLKAETSESDFDTGAAADAEGGGDGGMEEAAQKRGEYQDKARSKL
ncbi:hypothetical protein K504DRAFT_467569 [Pleomassaria siparia CBS 279.74]|uniref:Uncharacterized protein n=1 Tax=Pleomassaria siparia CBS 279.74 TaxID=1314801 RepID=A0A6G1K9V9_9PLEO|nr:hypothetical protein K504DRAFT_467569 [Pleomassaria siparia CBS 279.74]